MIDTIEDEMQKPYVPSAIIEYLEKTFSTSEVLYATELNNADERVGYMKGVNRILEHLKAILEEQSNVPI